MRKSSFNLTEKQKDEIRQERNKAKSAGDTGYLTRLTSLLYVSDPTSGHSVTSAAKALRVERSSVNNWMRLYREKGIDGLKTNYRKQKLSRIQYHEIKIALTRRVPESYNEELQLSAIEGEKWSQKLLSRFILKKFGVEFDRRHVTKILNRNGIFKHQNERKRAEARKKEEDYKKREAAKKKFEKR